MIALHNGMGGRGGRSLQNAVVASLLLITLILGLSRWQPLHQHLHSDRLASAFSSFGNKKASHEAASNIPPPPTTPQLAKALDPQDLMARGLASDQTVVPKIFHQSWSDKNLPTKFQEWSRSCREKHADWEWVLWTDQDNRDLVTRHAPWLLHTYEGLENEIYRADFSRNLYMHIYGGVYADLDVECLRSTDDLLAENEHTGRTLFVGSMGTDADFGHSIPNAWMASTPGHPFWIMPLEDVQARSESDMAAEGVTGPLALRDKIHEYRKKYDGNQGYRLDERYDMSAWRTLYELDQHHPHSVHVLPFWAIYPFSWSRDGAAFSDYCHTIAENFNTTRCKELTAVDHWGRGGSYTITYWSHSWAYGSDQAHSDDRMAALEGSNTSSSVDEDVNIEDIVDQDSSNDNQDTESNAPTLNEMFPLEDWDQDEPLNVELEDDTAHQAVRSEDQRAKELRHAMQEMALHAKAG